MDPSVTVAVVALASALLVAGLAVLGNRSKYPAEYMADVREDLQVARAERAAALIAAARALAAKGVVEAYARQLEDTHGVPHRRWTDHPMDVEGGA